MTQVPFKRKAFFSSGSNRPRHGSLLALVAIGGIVYFVVAVVILHVLRPELNPVRRAVSNYAIGSFGFLMISAFFTLALSEFALAMGLARSLTRSRRTFISVLLLSLAGAGLVVTGIFPGDVKSSHPPGTATAVVHWSGAGISFLSLMIAAFLLASCFKMDEQWHSFQHLAFVLAVAMVLALVVFGALTTIGWVGLGERIYIAAALLWPVVTSARLLAVSKHVKATFS